MTTDLQSIPDDARWNANLHLLRRLLPCVPPGARRGLDIGCGEGVTARLLRRHVESVVGVDQDAPSIAMANTQGGDVTYVEGSFTTHPLEPGSFDVVTAVAVLHHVDLEDALRRIEQLLAPGGVLLVVGFGRFRTLRDYAYAAVGVGWIRRYSWLRGSWETPSPKRLDCPLTFDEASQVYQRVLPGSRFERTVFFRYTVVWRKP